MKTVKIKLYSFDELSKDAQKRALNDFVNEMEYFNGDEAIESLQKFAEHFNSEFKSYSIDWNEPYRSEGYFSVPDYMKDISEDELLSLIKSMGTYNKKTLRGDGDCVFTGVCFDENCADGGRKAYFNGEREVKELLNAGFKEWMKITSADYAYQCTKEYYSEHCDANEYTFEEDGEMHNIPNS